MVLFFMFSSYFSASSFFLIMQTVFKMQTEVALVFLRLMKTFMKNVRALMVCCWFYITMVIEQPLHIQFMKGGNRSSFSEIFLRFCSYVVGLYCWNQIDSIFNAFNQILCVVFRFSLFGPWGSGETYPFLDIFENIVPSYLSLMCRVVMNIILQI